MAFVVVDTDVLSFCFKGDSRAASYRPHLEGNVLVLSFMTVAEIRYWTLVRKWGAARRVKLEKYFEKFVVHPYDDDLCTVWAEVTFQASQIGVSLTCADAWIAATALRHAIPLVTYNARDFSQIKGLVVRSETAT